MTVHSVFLLFMNLCFQTAKELIRIDKYLDVRKGEYAQELTKKLADAAKSGEDLACIRSSIQMFANRPHFLTKSLSHGESFFLNFFGTYQRPTVLVSLKIRDVIDQPDGETSHLTVAKGQEVLIKTVMSHKTTTTKSYSNVFKPLINIRWEIPCELIKWVFLWIIVRCSWCVSLG